MVSPASHGFRPRPPAVDRGRKAPLPGERGWGVGVRSHPVARKPLTLSRNRSLALTGAQALSRRERERMRGVRQKSPYGRYPNPFPINPLTKSPRKKPALVPPRAIIPLSRRPGGSLGRRSAAAAGADGAGATRSQTLRGRLPRGCEVEPGEKPDGRGGGEDTRTGPGDGRCHPCPPCAEGPLVNSEAHGPRMWKPVRAERLTFAETVFLVLFRAKARRSANAPHRRRTGAARYRARYSTGRIVLTILPVSRAEPSSARSRRVAARLSGPPSARLTASMPASPASEALASR